MKKILAVMILFLNSAANCSVPSSKNIVVENSIASKVEWCGMGCFHLQHLIGRDGLPGCEESRSLPGLNGEVITCEQFCRDTENNGRELSPDCWIQVNSCSELDELRKHQNSCVESK